MEDPSFVKTLSPEEVREKSLNYEEVQELSLKRVFKFCIPVILWIAIMLIFGENSKNLDFDSESPVFAQSIFSVTWILFGLGLLFYGLTRVSSFEKAYTLSCPKCEKRIRPHELKLLVTTDRCPKCGRTIIEPSCSI